MAATGIVVKARGMMGEWNSWRRSAFAPCRHAHSPGRGSCRLVRRDLHLMARWKMVEVEAGDRLRSSAELVPGDVVGWRRGQRSC